MLNEQLQKQIEQEAEAGQHTYPGTDYGHGFNKGYDSGYKLAGEKYVKKWQEEEQKADRYEKALEQIKNLSTISNLPDGSVKGAQVLRIAREALTPKTTGDDTDNG